MRLVDKHDAFRLMNPETALQWFCALAFIAFLLTLTGCDNAEFERLQREAEWNAKVMRACLPTDSEPMVTVKLEDGEYIVRRYAIEPKKVTVSKTVLWDEAE